MTYSSQCRSSVPSLFRRRAKLGVQIAFVAFLVTCSAGAMGTFAIGSCPCFGGMYRTIPTPPVEPIPPEKVVEKITDEPRQDY